MRPHQVPIIASAGLLYLLASGCQPGQPPAISLEAAKEKLVEFGSQSLRPPPKTIIDIEKLLQSQSAPTSSTADQDRELLASEPPFLANDAKLALHYLQRSKAANRLGLISQAVEDIRKSVSYSSKVENFIEHIHIMNRHVRAELNVGNYLKSIRLREALIARRQSVSNISLLIVEYAKGGNLEKATKLVSRMEYVFERLKSTYLWPNHGEAWSGNILRAKAIISLVEGELADAERDIRLAVKHWDNYRRLKPANRRDVVYGYVIDDFTNILLQRGVGRFWSLRPR